MLNEVKFFDNNCQCKTDFSCINLTICIIKFRIDIVQYFRYIIIKFSRNDFIDIRYSCNTHTTT